MRWGWGGGEVEKETALRGAVTALSYMCYSLAWRAGRGKRSICKEIVTLIINRFLKRGLSLERVFRSFQSYETDQWSVDNTKATL